MNHKQLSELPESPKSPNETSIEIQTDISYATIYDNGKFNHSSDQNYFIFEINVGNSRIRHRTTLKLNFWIHSDVVIQIKSRSKSEPNFSDIDVENKMVWVWTTLKQI